jgi:hypothetical protein
MRLRVAVHAGRVLADPQPLHGEAVIHACRLRDSPAVHTCLQTTERPLAGPDRVRADPAAATRLVRLCGRLPLAIQITGRRLATRPAWSLADYAARLADEQQHLDQLRFSDRAVRGCFQLSYQLLADRDPYAARALRLLLLLDGPEISVPAAAALLDALANKVEAILEGLVDAGTEPTCRCSATPTRSTSPSPPRSCCTRHARRRPAGSPNGRSVPVGSRFDQRAWCHPVVGGVNWTRGGRRR